MAPSGSGGDELRRLIQTFIRSIGLLAGDQTPCGQPLPVSHAHALMVLLEAAGERESLTQRELGLALGIDKSNVTRLCSRMVRAGHVVQRRPDDDGRARHLSLTPAGAKVATTVERSSHARFQRLMASIPLRSRASVLSSLACLNEALATVDLPGRPRRTPPRSADADEDQR